MKKSPLPCLFKPFAIVLAIVFSFAACQNASHIVAADSAWPARPAVSAAQELPAYYSSGYSVSALYNEYQYQWGLFTTWLSTGMMQPRRTVFPN